MIMSRDPYTTNRRAKGKRNLFLQKQATEIPGNIHLNSLYYFILCYLILFYLCYNRILLYLIFENNADESSNRAAVRR